MAAETIPNHCPPPSTEPYPWLVFWHDEGYKHQTFCTITESGSLQVDPRRRSIPELQNKAVVCCSYGWLVLVDDENGIDHYTLWNPSTLDSITLPPKTWTPEFVYRSSVLTSPPRTPNSWLLLFDAYGPNILCIRLDHDDPQWVEKKFGEQLKTMEVQDEPFYQTCCSNGVVVCMTKSYHWLTLHTHPDDGPVILKTLKEKPFGVIHSFYSDSCLVEFQRHVFSIQIFLAGVRWEEVVSIEIFRLNLDTEEWEEVESAEDQVFFLGDLHESCDVCCPALSSDPRGGHIFFTLDEQKLVYSYNIAQRSLSIAFRFPDLPMQWSTPSWVMPNYRLVDDLDKLMMRQCRLVDDLEKFKNEIATTDEINQEEKSMVEVKFIEAKDCKDSKQIDLLALPQTIIEELSDHLVLLDYMNFRSVCRRFSMAAPAIHWRESPSADSCLLPPWLMFVGEDRKSYNLIDSKFNGRYFMRIPDELQSATICNSKDGWLLMRKNDNSVVFYNPFTRAVLQCPDKPHECLPFVGSVLSSVPTSSECLVVEIASRSSRTVSLQILGYHHDEFWTRLEFDYESDFEANSNSPVFWGGAFYFLGEKGNLGVLKREETGSYSWNVLDKPQPPCESFNQNFLVECDGDLLSIFVGDCGEWVRVFKLDQSDLVWYEVHTLAHHTVYVSRSSSFSTVAKSKEMENRIYFPRLHRGSLVFYSLETHKLHSSNCLEDSLVDYCGSSEQLLCGWIEPRWS